ncbi:hypothetical protein C8Q72DRAFT_521919 [Fomitopsis betulina]|nr:hypothetical protein C8Q72DRAFT_521919 [Fomitopsis betulina]
MDFLTSNNDILCLVVKMLSSQEAIPVSSTSRALYTASRRHALSNIRIRSESQLARMHSCLVGAGAGGDLTIHPTGIDIAGHNLRPAEMFRVHQRSIQAIIDILRKLPELEHFCLSDCEGLLSAHSDLLNCIISLQRIADLSLQNVGPISFDALCRMACRPKQISIVGPRDEYIDNDAFLRIGQSPVLDEARYLSFIYFNVNYRATDQLHEDPVVEPRPRSRPHLKKLKLLACCSQPFLAMFPGIRELYMTHHYLDPDVRRTQVPPRLQLDLLSINTSYEEYIPFATFRILDWTMSTNSSDILLDACAKVNVANAVVLRLRLSEEYADFGPAECTRLARAMAAPSSRVRSLVLTFVSPESARGWIVSISHPKKGSSVTFSAKQEHFPPSRYPTDILCVEVVLVMNEPPQSLVSYTSPEQREWTLVLAQLEKAHLSAIRSLRFYCTYQTMDFIPRRPQLSVLKWGRVDGYGEHRAIKPISNVTGEAIKRYLQSPEFCQTLRFDEDAVKRYG